MEGQFKRSIPVLSTSLSTDIVDKDDGLNL